ncbi:hypothetical protein D3C76_837510 [compost metagenome]
MRIDGQPGDIGEAAEQFVELRRSAARAGQRECLNPLFKECWKPPGELFDRHILKLQTKVSLALLLLLPELADRCLDALPVREHCLG